MRLSAAALLVGLTACGHSPATTTPSVRSHEVGDIRGTTAGRLAPEHGSIIGMSIGRITLESISRDLGPVKPLSRENLSREICYSSPADGTRVVFETGAMGSWQDLTSFSVVSAGAAVPAELTCAPSSRVSRQVATPGQLRLGMTRDAVEAELGKPTQTDGPVVSWFLQQPGLREGCEVLGGVSATFDSGLVTSFRVSNIESC